MSHIEHNYSIEDRLMVKEYGSIKLLGAKKRGIFTIVQIFMTTTERLQLMSHVHETISIMKIWSYKG